MKNLNILILLSIFLFVSCHTQKYIDKPIEEENSNFEPVKLTTEEYIDKFKHLAIWEMKHYKVPASIILAQSILESGNGNSDLARIGNNHFGIKCKPDWKGKTFYKDDDKKNDCFKAYNDVKESFTDHMNYLQGKRYEKLFNLDITDYKAWAKGLKKYGYATNPQYPQLLISIIEKYKLYKYDN